MQGLVEISRIVGIGELITEDFNLLVSMEIFHGEG
jgi:hypothetical protein